MPIQNPWKAIIRVDQAPPVSSLIPVPARFTIGASWVFCNPPITAIWVYISRPVLVDASCRRTPIVKDKLRHLIHRSIAPWAVPVIFRIRTTVRSFTIATVKAEKHVQHDADRSYFSSSLGIKNHSESLLCTAGRLWSSRKCRTNECERKQRSRHCLGHENCVLPDEVPECEAQRVWRR